MAPGDREGKRHRVLTESMNQETKSTWMEQVHTQQARIMRSLREGSWGFGREFLLSLGDSSRNHCEDVVVRPLRDMVGGHRSPRHTWSLGTRI